MAHDWTQDQTLGDWMRSQEKRTMRQERRSALPKAADILGPGVASTATHIIDWSGEETEFNGFFYSEPGAMHTPDTAKWWIGWSITQDGLWGIQRVWDYQGETSPPAEYTRTFQIMGATRLFTDWANSGVGAETGIRTFHETEPPIGLDAADIGRAIWYDTDDGDHPYLWSDNGLGGMEWVSMRGDGTQGPEGPQGPEGMSAYQVAVLNGFVGTEAEWLASLEGDQGIPGPPGDDGQALYTWIKYADTPTTGMSNLPDGKTYMGIAYNKTSPTESTVYTDYEWSLIKGETGDQGIPGPPGDDGSPTYTWIKYADNAAGAGMADLPAGKTYLGIAYNKTTPTESTVATDYAWSLIQGPQGVKGDPGTPAATIALTATAQVLVTPSPPGATTPPTSTVTGTAVNTTITAWTYSVDGGTWTSTPPAGVSRTGNVVTITGSTMTAKTIAVKMADANGVADTLTVAKVSNGATGGTGSAGVGVTGTVVTYQVGTSGTTAPTGTWQTTPQATSPGQYLWTRTVTTYSDSSTSTAYSVAAHGSTGSTGGQGPAGVGVTGTAVTYQIGTSGTTAPTGTWLSTPQATAPGQFLWTRTVTTYSDASTSTAYSVAAHGSTGSTGVGVTGTAVTYQVHTSGTATPTGTWLSTPQATSPGQFLWTRTVTTYSDASTSTAYSVAAHGTTGSAGKGVSSTAVTYQVATSGTVTPTGTWQSTPQATSPGQFLWTRTITTYTDATTTTAYSVSAHGSTGADAYTVLLTNEAQVFAGSTTAALAGSTTSQVIAYKGGTQVAATIGTITGQVTGLTAAVRAGTNSTTAPIIDVAVTTALTTKQGELTIPVTVDGKTFTKKFSWSLSLTGQPGQDLAASDNLAPLGSPTPTVYGGFGALAVTFTPLTFPATRSTTGNPDPVTYDVHLSTTSTVAGDATTLVAKDVSGSPVFLRTRVSGSSLVALVPDTDYWLAIRAKDRDGNGPLSTVFGPVRTAKATGSDIILTVAMLIANGILADAIDAEDLTGVRITGALIRTAASGPRWQMFTSDGNVLEGYSNDVNELEPARVFVQNPTTGFRPGSTALQLIAPRVVGDSADGSDQSSLQLSATDQSGPYVGKSKAQLWADRTTLSGPAGGTEAIVIGTLDATMRDGDVGTGTFRDSVDLRADARIAAKRQTARYYKTGTQSVATSSGHDTLVQFGTNDSDLAENFGQTINAGSDVFTLPAGKYQIRVKVTFANATGGRRSILVTRNSASAPTQSDAALVGGDNRAAVNPGVSTVETLIQRRWTTPTALRVWVGQNSGASLSIGDVGQGGAELVIERLGD